MFILDIWMCICYTAYRKQNTAAVPTGCRPSVPAQVRTPPTQRITPHHCGISISSLRLFCKGKTVSSAQGEFGGSLTFPFSDETHKSCGLVLHRVGMNLHGVFVFNPNYERKKPQMENSNSTLTVVRYLPSDTREE